MAGRKTGIATVSNMKNTHFIGLRKSGYFAFQIHKKITKNPAKAGSRKY